MSDTQPNTAEFGRQPDPSKPEEAPQPSAPQPAAPKPAAPQTASEALKPQAGTPPPVRRSRASRNQIVVFMNFLISLVMLAVVGAGAAVYFGKRAFDAPGPTAAASTFLVRPNTGVARIAADLEQNGLITDATIFRLGIRAYGGEATLKAGEYQIEAGASMRDVMKLLQSGRSMMYSLTIPEGLTVDQALRRVADHEALTGDMPAEVPAEGSLAADTQRFTRGAERRVVIENMMAQQEALIDEIWAKRAPDLPVADINEFVTLASIVEKETGVDSERPHVASVFVNRLRRNMRLQTDPTVIYGIGPNPLQTDDLYFVADGTGGHVFAETLEQHNRNVARWRAIQKKQAGEAAKAGSQDADTAQ